MILMDLIYTGKKLFTKFNAFLTTVASNMLSFTAFTVQKIFYSSIVNKYKYINCVY